MSKPVDDTGWQKPGVIETPDGVAGAIVPATGLEQKPCMMCKSFENDQRRLMQHLQAHGLRPDENGFYETPIAKEVKGRRSLKINPRDMGWCRRNGGVVHMNATCEDFKPTETRNDLALKLQRR